MQLWIGTSGFQYAAWKGSFYPETLPVNKMLGYYSQHLSSSEINYSFRRIPSLKTIADWSGATPPGFRFSFKAPQKITHFGRLHGHLDTLEYFLEVLTQMNGKLGAVLFQLPPDFIADAPRLDAFLTHVPKGFRSAFEFRHPSWFQEEVFSTLRTHNAALCIAESEKLATPPEVTADFGYLRLRREDYTHADISRWATFVRSQEEKWKDAFIYFKHEEAGIGPELARQMADGLA